MKEGCPINIDEMDTYVYNGREFVIQRNAKGTPKFVSDKEGNFVDEVFAPNRPDDFKNVKGGGDKHSTVNRQRGIMKRENEAYHHLREQQKQHTSIEGRTFKVIKSNIAAGTVPKELIETATAEAKKRLAKGQGKAKTLDDAIVEVLWKQGNRKAKDNPLLQKDIDDAVVSLSLPGSSVASPIKRDIVAQTTPTGYYGRDPLTQRAANHTWKDVPKGYELGQGNKVIAYNPKMFKSVEEAQKAADAANKPVARKRRKARVGFPPKR